MTDFTADHNAPVYATGQIEIAADPESVWEIMTDVERWPSWNPEVKSASIVGPVAEGTGFTWKAGPGTIRSTIRIAERPFAIGWSGKTMTIGARHLWWLQPTGAGTIVRTEESWHGFLARLFRKQFQVTVQKAIDTGLRYLKAEAEKRSGGPSS